MDTISTGNVPLKMWTDGVPVEQAAIQQLRNVAELPFVHSHVAVMPDVHYGIGATVGSVIPTVGAIVPAAVGVDIGCGMVASLTNLRATDLPDSLRELRGAIEHVVPVGKASHAAIPTSVRNRMDALGERYDRIVAKHPGANTREHPVAQIGTLGGGNHFIEVCLDEGDRVWVMLHSGSRGIGNRIGTYFIAKARDEMLKTDVRLPDRDLAYLGEGSELFGDYVDAVGWAQDYAAENRREMLSAVVKTIRIHLPTIALDAAPIVDCHHNYVNRERHFGADVWLTRKGAVSARSGELGIIPGSMGARSYIVRGRGNPDSFHSCSHGAGRAMSRGEAKRRFTVEDHIAATSGVECRKDIGVLDETPGAYKPIDAVMAAQAELVDVVHELRQVLCVKG